MKNLNITYDDKNFKEMEKIKDKSGLDNWEDFIFYCVIRHCPKIRMEE